MSDDVFKDSGLDPNAQVFTEPVTETEDTSQVAVGGEPETSPPPETPPAEEPAAEQNVFRSSFQQKFGVDLSKYKSDDEAQRGLAEAVKLVGKRDQDAEVGKLLRENPAVVVDYLRRQSPEIFGQPEKTEPEKKESNVPEWQDEWAQQVERNEAGALVAKAGFDPQLPQKIAKYTKWFEKKNQDIAANFETTIDQRAEAIARKIAPEIAQQIVQQQLGQHAQAAVAAGWLEQQKTWLFNNGEMRPGNFSPRGAAFAQAMDKVAKAGVTDMNTQIEIAMGLIGSAAPATPKKQTQQATRQTNVASSTSGDPDARRPKETIDDFIARRSKELNLDLGAPVHS